MDKLELELKLAEQHLERAQREYHAAQDQVSHLRAEIKNAKQIDRITARMRAEEPR